MPDPADVTRLLRDPDADHGQLLALLYDELRSVAGRRMGAERAGHTLQATALGHDAYVRLLGQEQVQWRDRGHFYAAAAEAMRRVLLDHAKAGGREKRGGDRRPANGPAAFASIAELAAADVSIE